MSISSKILTLSAILFFNFSIGFSQTENQDTSFSKDTPLLDSIAVPSKIQKQSLFNFLTAHEMVKATLTTDLNKLEDPKNKTAYWDGEFALESPLEAQNTFKVKVRLRGRFRLAKCDFPPLKLKFKKKGLKKNSFRKRYNKMKLVTHCLNDSRTSEDLILREYLAYKLFNIINEFSFRTQLVKMKYVNTEKKRDKRKGLGILIEDSQEVADRIGGKTTKELGINRDLFNKKQEQLTALFQFMIANTDWNNQRNKNVKLIETEEEEIFSVPYDFDFSGFVSAPYARLTSQFGQKSLKDRVFLGDSKTIEELQPAIDVFLNKKTAVLNEISNFKLLSKASRVELKKFIKEFYKTLENKEDLETVLFSKK